MSPPDFVEFLLQAKKNTYASGMPPNASSRPGSHDLVYRQDPYLYIDTYLGGFHFIGEEAVWHDGINTWGMNYYGNMLTPEIPPGFSQFLKTALLLTPLEAPFRGPAEFISGDFRYQCSSSGDLYRFEGREEIQYRRAVIYTLVFHGGEIRD
ncbi:MAG TPA: DUF5680 domain-containing protein [Anaerolineaceae bacterium]|nr:DUF5680 domain-containing protein [Anaerolineaceae bacterium]